MDTPIAEMNTRDNLMKLLDELGEHPERIEDVTQRIEEIFGQERTIMVLDMSGFTRATQQGNIISFLLSINQMQRLVTPVVEEGGGLLVRAEHDNLTCLFDKVIQAVEASREITGRLAPQLEARGRGAFQVARPLVPQERKDDLAAEHLDRRVRRHVHVRLGVR